MQLNVHDRLRIGAFVPQQSDRVTLTIARDIIKKTELNQEESVQIGLRPNPMNPAQIIWGGEIETIDKDGKKMTKKTEKADIDKWIDFTDAELKVLKEEEKKKNDAKTLIAEDLDISEKIVNARLSAERIAESKAVTEIPDESA